MNNKKGFTLIVVVGILMIMGIVATYASKKVNKESFLNVKETINKTNIEYAEEAYNILIEENKEPVLDYTFKTNDFKGQIYSKNGLILDDDIEISEELNLLNRSKLEGTGLIIEDDILYLIDKKTQKIYILEE